MRRAAIVLTSIAALATAAAFALGYLAIWHSPSGRLNDTAGLTGVLAFFATAAAIIAWLAEADL